MNMNVEYMQSISDDMVDWYSVSGRDQGGLACSERFLNLRMCLFQELEASDELDTICPKAPKLEER